MDDKDVRTLRYSTNRFKKVTKCSALRILPGTASCSKSSGKAMGLRLRADTGKSRVPHLDSP